MDAHKPLKQLTSSLAPKGFTDVAVPPGLTSVPEATYAGIETCSRSIAQIRASFLLCRPRRAN
jgi:hypothetical protein